MKLQQWPPNYRTVTTGSKKSDAELMHRIFSYQKEHNLEHATDAVRQLCETALSLENTVKKCNS